MGKDTMGNNPKKGSLTIRLEYSLLNKYKSLCEKNGFDMSKRIRLFIEHELNNISYSKEEFIVDSKKRK